MRVLFLASRDWYHPATTGGDMTLWENARYLASAGHDVTFVATGYSGAARQETVDGITVVRLGRLHLLWLRTFLYYLLHRREGFDVVVAEGFGGSRIPRLAPLYVREPLITEWHQVHRDLFEAQYPKVLRGPLNLLERLTVWINRDTVVRAGTEEWRDAFVGIGFKPEKVFVLPVSIRDDWSSQSTPASVSEPNILWLGKIRRYKRPEHAIEAMPAILERVSRARLKIAGRHDDRNYERQLQSRVDALGLKEHVEFRFDLTETEKRDLIARSRVMVVPSAVEGFGIVVLEANASGVPVVASSRVPEGAVRDGLNGLRYPYGDIPALAASVSRVLEDETLYRRLSDNGRAFARDFAWSRIGPRFARIVETVAAGWNVEANAKRDENGAKVS